MDVYDAMLRLTYCRARRPQCAKSAKILQSFLADPHHPESALNSIPKEVLARAKGSVSHLAVRARSLNTAAQAASSADLVYV